MWGQNGKERGFGLEGYHWLYMEHGIRIVIKFHLSKQITVLQVEGKVEACQLNRKARMKETLFNFFS